MELHEYKNRFKCVTVERSDTGVLVVQMTNRGNSLVWGGLPHRELRVGTHHPQQTKY